MVLRGSVAFATAGAALALSASPLSAQSSVKSTMVTGHRGKPQGRVVLIPGYAYPVYILPAERDERTPRQRCWDDETARIGGALSDLDRRAIDLKCSQR